MKHPLFLTYILPFACPHALMTDHTPSDYLPFFQNPNYYLAILQDYLELYGENESTLMDTPNTHYEQTPEVPTAPEGLSLGTIG